MGLLGFAVGAVVGDYVYLVSVPRPKVEPGFTTWLRTHTFAQMTAGAVTAIGVFWSTLSFARSRWMRILGPIVLFVLLIVVGRLAIYGLVSHISSTYVSK